MIQLRDLEGPPLPDTALNIDGFFRRNVLDFPNTVALVCPHQPSKLYGIPSLPIENDENEAPYLRWTYRNLDHAIQRFANELKRQGFREGDLIFIFMTNTVEYVIATLAAYRTGGIHVPINPRSLSHTQEVQHMIQTAINGCSAKSITTIAGNADLCPQIEKLTSGLNCMKILVEGQVNGWTSFKNLMHEPTEPAVMGQRSLCRDCDPEPVGSTILFTSGTTSLPKGCFHPSSLCAFTYAIRWRQSSQPLLPGDRITMALPNNHAYSQICLMASFINAATVVFPGPSFVPEAMIQAIQQEECSHAVLVPTMVLALKVVLSGPGQKLNSLRRVMVGGSLPTEAIIRTCLEQLGASGVENLYGMTEGVQACTDVVGHVNDIVKGRDVSIGMPFPGGRTRVCAAGSTTPLPVGVAGELHFSGPTLVRGYIGSADDDKFYEDGEGRKWFCSGDKVFMGQDDQIYLVGRYKDTIIRGGENIEPTAIEAVLVEISEFSILDPQIVRSPDEIAGEVPIAIVNQNINEDTARRLQDAVQAKMGTMYAPVEVLSLQSLGLNDYPRTMVGKVQKSKLENVVKKCREERVSQPHNSLYTRTLLELRLKKAWAQRLGFSNASLIDVNASLAAFASDLMLESLQRKVWHDVASHVPFSDWVAADSIAEQAQLIDNTQHDQSTDDFCLENGQNIMEQSLGSRVMEALLSAIAAEKDCQISTETQMIELGVDSILSIAILHRVQKETGVSLPSSIFSTLKTVGEIGDRLCSISDPKDLVDFTMPTDAAPPDLCFSKLLQGTPKPGIPSLFLTPPGSGYALVYDQLPKFANDLAVYSLGSPFLMTRSEATWTVEEAAAIYLKTIRSLQAQGPYLLGGWCIGAATGYEIAYQLHQQGERVLGVINIDLPIPRPFSLPLEPSVKLLEIAGFFPSMRREGKPDIEIPPYRRQHSLSSVYAKMKYSPRPINTPGNATPVPIFIIWAGHGDIDRIQSVLLEARDILEVHGPQTQKRADQTWQELPRESFDSSGWGELVGEENVECHVIDHAYHETVLEPEVVCFSLIRCFFLPFLGFDILSNHWHRFSLRVI